MGFVWGGLGRALMQFLLFPAILRCWRFWPPRWARATHSEGCEWGRCKGAPQVQCARSATIWASGRTRDPYFEILGAPRGIMVTPSVDFDF